MDVLVCDNCGYERSSEQDGRSFDKVCGICYDDSCPTSTANVLLCTECLNIVAIEGENLLT